MAGMLLAAALLLAGALLGSAQQTELPGGAPASGIATPAPPLQVP
jgi:hypothetical protein